MNASAKNIVSSNGNSIDENSKRTFLNYVISFFGLELRSPGGRKEKILAIFSAIIVFSIGSVSNIGLTKLSDFFFPDATQKSLVATQEKIQEKVTNIEAIGKSITNQISAVDGKLSANLNSDIERLKEAVTSLQPDIAYVGTASGEAVRLFTEVKQNDIKKRNFSVLSDFVVPSGQGATVCPDRYIFSMKEAVGTSIEAALSGGGGQTRSALAPGDSVYLKTATGNIVQVAYQSKYGEGKDATYGFSVFCDVR
ncbi:hypothetical protein [Rhizobium sp. BR 314]|uniref:hypothetical protein n=1 Tax=Rhizobium sp. BR 314 TaxID=3040013 RepID=UPI0039BF0797